MLYLVATPIGNLGDMSFRAIEVLKSVDLIASEDSRHSSILLNHYEISKPQTALNNFNDRKVAPKLIERMKRGETIALISDAGTPGISDPGYLLVRLALDEDIEVQVIPGPSAGVMVKEGPRKRFLAMDAESGHTMVFYESPYRLLAFLDSAIEVLGDRQAALANDLTKKFEKVLRGSLSDIKTWVQEDKIRGEYVICIEGLSKDARKKQKD